MKVYMRSEAKVKDMLNSVGGDCWSEAFIVRQAFSDKNVKSVRWDHISTGLYVDVQVFVNGLWIERRIYS